MKTIFTYFWIILLVILSIAASAQSSEMLSTLTGKEHLKYTMTPELSVWERIAGFDEPKEEESRISASYNASKKQLVVDGTAKSGEVEVWDINGNTVYEKASAEPKTVFKANTLQRGTYFINYSNGTISEGVKLSIR